MYCNLAFQTLQKTLILLKPLFIILHCYVTKYNILVSTEKINIIIFFILYFHSLNSPFDPLFCLLLTDMGFICRNLCFQYTEKIMSAPHFPVHSFNTSLIHLLFRSICNISPIKCKVHIFR